MRKAFRNAWIAAAAAALFLAGSTGIYAEALPAAEEKTLTDMTGREVAIPEDLKRIVALTPADCEILCELGAEDLIVARSPYCDYPASVQELPVVQSGENTSVEEILSYDPQVVVMATMAQSEEQISQLEDAGVSVVVSNAADIEGIYQNIDILGQLTGREEAADQLEQEMKDKLASLAEKAKEQKGGRVYFEVSPLQFGLWTAGSGTFMDEAAKILNLENIFSDVEGWAEISEEQVIERDPEVIVTIWMGSDPNESPQEEISARKGWDGVSAVKDQKIISFTGDELSRPAPRLADGISQIYDYVYGE